jgi:hypothetical protein
MLSLALKFAFRLAWRKQIYLSRPTCVFIPLFNFFLSLLLYISLPHSLVPERKSCLEIIHEASPVTTTKTKGHDGIKEINSGNSRYFVQKLFSHHIIFKNISDYRGKFRHTCGSARLWEVQCFERRIYMKSAIKESKETYPRKYFVLRDLMWAIHRALHNVKLRGLYKPLLSKQ